MSPFILAEKHEIFGATAMYAPAPFSRLSPAAKEEYWATLALRHCPGIGLRTIHKLLAGFGSAYQACKNLERWKQHVNDKKAIEFARERWRSEAEKEWNQAKKSECYILLWRSHSYPYLLRELSDPPSLLYCMGNLQLLNGPAIAIVGTRNPTPYGKKIAEAFGRELSSAGITVVSGMASGIDREAHIGAMESIGGSIGILGTGIDWIYPKSNSDIYKMMKEKGLLLAEFPPATPPCATNFPIRNRIISGISLGVVVVEAANRSGSLVTARLALEQNREVFAIPGQALSVTSLGCQNLIRQGARTVFSSEDILHDLEPNLRPFLSRGIPEDASRLIPQPCALPEEEGKAIKYQPGSNEVADVLLTGSIAEKILGCLQQRGCLHIEQLSGEIGCGIAEISTALLGLELTGQIVRHPGGRIEAI